MVSHSSGKLVRDGIPRIIEESGGNPRTVFLPREQFLEALGGKLAEEVGEYLAATDRPSQLEELADVYEVMLALLRELGTDWSELTEIAGRKRDARGGFDNGVWLF